MTHSKSILGAAGLTAVLAAGCAGPDPYYSSGPRPYPSQGGYSQSQGAYYGVVDRIEVVRRDGGTTSSMVLPIKPLVKASIACAPSWRMRNCRRPSPASSTSHRISCSGLCATGLGEKPVIAGKRRSAASAFQCAISAR